MDVKRMTVGMADCIVQRVSYTADLGYEIFSDHMSVRQRICGHALDAAGQDLGIRPFGMRAMMSLRLDKCFGSWGREFSPDYTPAETGLDRFIRWNKPADWIGKAAAMKEKAEGPKRKLVRLRRRCRTMPMWSRGSRSGWTARWWASAPRAATATGPANRSRRASCPRTGCRTG